jgi:hypothetical protein
MKRIILIGILLVNCCSIYAQKVDWKQIDNKEDEFNLTSTFYLLNDNTFCALYVTPPAKRSKKTFENYVLRTFNNDYSDYSEIGIPPETPNRFIVQPFKDYTMIYGCDVEPWKTNPRLDNYLRSRVIFADKLMNPLLNIELKQYNEKYILEGAPKLYFSYDSSFVIFANIEKPFSNSSSIPFGGGGYEKKQYGITIVNGNMEKVWSGVVNFEDLFGNGVQVDDFKFDYINNHFYAIASVKGAPTKKMPSAIYIVEFDEKGTSNIIHKEVFKMQPLVWDSYIDKNQLMTVGGYYTTSCKNLFSFQYNFTLKDIKKPVKTIVVDNDITKGNDEMQKIFKPDFIFPFTLIPMPDGFIWYREDAVSSEHFCIEDIKMIKFDNNLNLKWVKRIHKSYKAFVRNSDNYFSSYFVRDNKLVIFYYDYKDFIDKEFKLQVFGSRDESDLCLVMATVSPNGEITKELVSNIKVSQTLGYTSNMFAIDRNKYILTGIPYTWKDTDDAYIGTIDLSGK